MRRVFKQDMIDVTAQKRQARDGFKGLGPAQSQSQPDNRLRSTIKANDAMGGSAQSEQTRRGAQRRKNQLS